MRLAIEVPDNTPLPFIVAALLPFGASVLEGEAMPRVSRAPRPRKAKREPIEYRELVYTRPDGNGGRESVEMDGLEVAQRIRRLMAECAARQRADGRNVKHFPRWGEGSSPAVYVQDICARWSHVKAQYIINGEAVTA